ncbi:MAG: YmdB family metallophosphoesterase [Alphaproteobacteria bacterium]|nr:MAG: YmdB family metallophosphoesterase [Alphaproteobacteria bacterium]TAF13459.1 MAG: YmdB family metallophosphoesterase [Alphaproteobacteria bacterium]TAF41278.1 MAG: YmdB family metallophosphoesterase [Alphaproteobacteria bacterium]TAF76287.1 MAG: YmdB family metallophosphoesterase [Alphaproteobacteria bacterium]
MNYQPSISRQYGDLRILFCGDIVGRAGKDAVVHYVPKLRISHDIDMVIASADNVSGGFGVTPDLCKELFAAGVDVLTGGDHVWDQKDTHHYLNYEPRLLRPHNFPEKTNGKGWFILETSKGKRIGVLHLLGQIFHKEYLDSPFSAADKILTHHRLGYNIDAIIVDMHAEATAEKNAMGVYLDGRVSAVVGSHTHVPTSDARILARGTAYHTDTGMCGDYHNSIIGFDPETSLGNFTMKMRKTRLQPAGGEGTLCATLVHISGTNGLARSIEHMMIGGAFATHTYDCSVVQG